MNFQLSLYIAVYTYLLKKKFFGDLTCIGGYMTLSIVGDKVINF